MISNTPMIRQSRHNAVESTDMHYNQNRNTPVNNQQVMPMTSNYYDRTPAYKRKNDFGDTSYKPEKLMRTAGYGMVHGLPKEDYDTMGSVDKSQPRHYHPSGTSSDTSSIPKIFDRHLGSGDGKFASCNPSFRYALVSLLLVKYCMHSGGHLFVSFSVLNTLN